MKIRLKIWRQLRIGIDGRFENYEVDNINPQMSLLETLDVLNQKLILKGKDPVAFESDCREGICGSCGMMINGLPHGPGLGVASCEIHMRQFQDGQLIVLEPWRAKGFPIIKDLIVDRSAFDRIFSAGSFISTNVGAAPEANSILVPRDVVEKAFDAGACIQCGACVAACPNASAALFTGAQIARLTPLPQGRPEAKTRVRKMVHQMDREGFGHCTNIGECEAACPKRISIDVIAFMRREYWKSLFR